MIEQDGLATIRREDTMKNRSGVHRSFLEMNEDADVVGGQRIERRLICGLNYTITTTGKKS